jgi:lipopolysaccharide export system protein LptA
MRFAPILAVVLIAAAVAADPASTSDDLKPSLAASSATIPAKPQKKSISGQDENVPVDIRGNRVEYQGKAGKVIFTGNVVVVRGTSRLTADELTTLKGAAEANARGRVTVKDSERKIDLTCAEAGYRNGLRYVKASGTCHLIAGEDENLTVVNSDEMELYVDTRDAVARGNVRINQAENEAECGEARLTEQGEKLTLTGEPVLRRPPHEFRAQEVISYVREGRLVMTGNVQAVLHTGKLGELKKEGMGQ